MLRTIMENISGAFLQNSKLEYDTTELSAVIPFTLKNTKAKPDPAIAGLRSGHHRWCHRPGIDNKKIKASCSIPPVISISYAQ